MDAPRTDAPALSERAILRWPWCPHAAARLMGHAGALFRARVPRTHSKSHQPTIVDADTRAATRKPQEEFIGTVDVWQLHHFRWPFMRLLCRPYVELRELRYYQHQLLATHRWTRVRSVPQRSEGGAVSTHVFDVYGVAR